MQPRRRASHPMMTRSCLWLGVLGLAALSAAADDPGAAAAGSDCAAPTALAIQRHYEAVRDMSARFEQTSRSVALGTAGAAGLARSRGRVVLAKPGRMRWAYEEPDPSLLVSDGHTLWLYDPTRREAQRLPVGEGYLSAAAVQFLLGSGDIQRDFRVSALACGAAAADLELLPRRDASYEKLHVRADPSTGEVQRTTVFDLLGNATEVAFSEVEINRSPPAETFAFDPPEGVDVIEVAPPPPIPRGGR